MEQNLLSSKEAANYCGLEYRAFLRLVKVAGIPHYNLASRFLKFKKSELDAWIESRKERGSVKL